MNTIGRVTRRLRGLGFRVSPESERQWLRSGARVRDWWRSRFVVDLADDGTLGVGLIVTTYAGKGNRFRRVERCQHIASGLSLADAVAVIERELQNARCRGQMNGWWHEKKERYD